jgi:hypothetical protein
MTAENERFDGREFQNCVHSALGNGPAGLPLVERRRTPRWSFVAAVSVLDPISGAHIEAHTTDLGPGGCYVDTMNSFPTGTKVQLRLTKDGKSVEADAVVACSQVGVGMGLALLSVAPGHRAVLDRWLVELSGASSAPHTLDEIKIEEPRPDASKTASEYALEELLVALMRKGLLTEEEGEPILRRLRY